MVLVAVVVVSALGAATALAGHSFTDTPDSHTFHGDIEWMDENGITRGCNPPANTEYCPDDFMTRGEMAAFIHRLALAGVVDADTLDGLDSTDFLRSNGKAADSDLLDGLDSSEFVTHSEVNEIGGVPGPQGPQGAQGPQGPSGPEGPQGPTGQLSADNVTLREASEGSGLVVVANTYTAMCEPGEVAIGGGYHADFTLVDLEGVDLPILGDLLGLVIDLSELDAALDGVSTVNVHAEGPVQDGGQWGWQIGTTANIAADITVQAICAG